MKHFLSMSMLVSTLAFVTSACDFAFAGETLVSNRCVSSSDCGDDELCDTGRQICVSTASAPLRVGLEIIPPNSSSSVGAVFSVAPVSITEATELDLTMPDPILVWGLVRWQGHGDQNVPVQISVVPGSVIPGHSSPSVPAMRATSAFHPELLDTAFVTNIGTQGEGPLQFDLIIRPTGTAAADLPPRRVHVVANDIVGGAFEVPNLDYPEHLVEIIGDVVDANGYPLPGLTVQAVDVATNDVVSSTATTSASSSETPGRFVIRLAPEVDNYVLRIASQETALAPMPTYAVSPDYLIAEDDVVRVRVNTTATFAFQGTIESEFTHETVPGALVQFRMTSDDLTEDGTFISAPVRTAANGSFSVLLVDGTYDIVITPPSDAVDAHNRLGVSIVEDVRIAAPVSGDVILGQVFSLPLRAAVTGSVMTSDGRPMVGATIEATALGRLLEVSPATVLNRSNQAVTDADGLFDLPLDLGVYDLTLKPPVETGFPWIVRTNFSVPPVDGVSEETLMFNAPIPLQGIVRDALGEALGNVEVRAFAVFDEIDGGVRSVQVARTVSQSDGSYELLLPPRL